jgi:hypothetical protein
MDVVLTRVSRGEADLGTVDPRLAPLLHAALSPQPRQRPDADEVVEALERYASGRPVTEALARPTRHTQPLEQPGTREWGRPPVVPEVATRPPLGPVALPPDTGELVPWDEDYEPEGDEVSDWQAAWQGGPGEPDPRIGRPTRTGTLVALLVALVAAVATFPVVAVALGLALSWAARTADRSVTSLVLRRYNKGRRRSDVPLAVAASPWHLVVGALAAVMSALLPAVVGTCAVFSAALATVAVTGGSPQPNSAPNLAVGGLVAALMAWWGPGGSGLRRGTRSIVRGVAPGPRATRVLVGVALVVALGLAGLAAQGAGAPDWWPTQAPTTALPGLG